MQRIDDSYKVSIDIDIHNFICPITLEIFFQPVMAKGCGHMFEPAALDDHMRNDSHCPVCRTHISEVIEPPRIFLQQIEDTLQKYPSLLRQRYFNIKYLINALNTQDKIKLDKLIQLLLLRPEYFSLALIYLVSTDDGIIHLNNNSELRAQITPEALNAISRNGVEIGSSPVLKLSKCIQGQNLLVFDADICNKISSATFNSILQAKFNHPDNGTCPVYWITHTHAGRDLLTTNILLRKKITPQGLNSICISDNTSGVLWLAKSEKGRQLFILDSDLCNMISAESFNRICTKGKNTGCSPLYFFCKHPNGRKLLRDNPRLLGLIKPETLNSTVNSENHQPAADWLQNTPDGREIIEENKELEQMIRSKKMRKFNHPEKEKTLPTPTSKVNSFDGCLGFNPMLFNSNPSPRDADQNQAESEWHCVIC